MGCWTLYVYSHKPVFNHLVTEALARYNTYYIMVCDRQLEVEQQVLENEIKEAFSNEYGIKIRRSGKRRFADMDRSEGTLEAEMPVLPVVAIDSFV